MTNSLLTSPTMVQWFGGFAILLMFTVLQQGRETRESRMGWEYLIVTHRIVLEEAMIAATQVRGKQRYFAKEAVNDERLLDMLGKQGWELFNVQPLRFGEYQFIFKRLSF